MNIARMKFIFLNTLQKEYRSLTLVVSFIFTMFIMLLVNFLLDTFFMLAREQNFEPLIGADKVQIFYYIISVWSLVLAPLFGANSIRSDMESNIIVQFFALPIKRSEYLFSRIMGSWFIIVLYYLICLIVSSIFFSMGSELSLNLAATIKSMLISSLTILALIQLVVFMTFYFSRLVSFILGFVTIILIYVSNAYCGAKTIAENFSDLNVWSLIAGMTHYLLPRIGVVNNMSNQVLLEKGFGKFDPMIEFGHFFGMIALYGIIMHFLLKKKDF